MLLLLLLHQVMVMVHGRRGEVGREGGGGREGGRCGDGGVEVDFGTEGSLEFKEAERDPFDHVQVVRSGFTGTEDAFANAGGAGKFLGDSHGVAVETIGEVGTEGGAWGRKKGGREGRRVSVAIYWERIEQDIKCKGVGNMRRTHKDV